MLRRLLSKISAPLLTTKERQLAHWPLPSFSRMRNSMSSIIRWLLPSTEWTKIQEYPAHMVTYSQSLLLPSEKIRLASGRTLQLGSFHSVKSQMAIIEFITSGQSTGIIWLGQKLGHRLHKTKSKELVKARSFTYSTKTPRKVLLNTQWLIHRNNQY